VVLAAN
jgi:dynein heavy chain